MRRSLYTIVGLLALAACNAPKQGIALQTDESEAIEKVIMTRRSIRQYTEQPIGRDTLEWILKCGINAPNGMGRQAYEIRVAYKPELLKEISEAVLKDNPGMSLRPGTSNIFADATCVVFLAHDTSYDMSQVDCGLLGENIVLSAWSKGIGSCCMAHPIRLMKESKNCTPYIEKLGFSEGYDLLYCIAMGYPDETPDARRRKETKIKFIE